MIVWDLFSQFPHYGKYDPRLDMRIRYRPVSPDVSRLIAKGKNSIASTRMTEDEIQAYILGYLVKI
jgi:hypothetical protein